MPEIHAAAYMGDVVALQERLKTEDPNYRAMGGITPLMSAVFKKQREAYEVLIRHGADPNRCDDNGQDVLSYVMDRDMREWLGLVLRTGTRPHPQRHRGFLVWAIRNESLSFVERILRISPEMIVDVDTENNSVLHVAIRYRYVVPVRDAMVGLLLRKGADPLAINVHGRKPMDEVVYSQSNESLRVRLQKAENAVWLFCVARVLQDNRRAEPFHAIPTRDMKKNEVLDYVICKMNPSLVQELSEML